MSHDPADSKLCRSISKRTKETNQLKQRSVDGWTDDENHQFDLTDRGKERWEAGEGGTLYYIIEVAPHWIFICF